MTYSVQGGHQTRNISLFPNGKNRTSEENLDKLIETIKTPYLDGKLRLSGTRSKIQTWRLELHFIGFHLWRRK